MKYDYTKKLKELREKKGKSIRAVSKDTGISFSAISYYENGKRIPTDENKIILAKYYRTSVGELFFNERRRK